jgi:hypothetical protein
MTTPSSTSDIRWLQRLDNYRRALRQLQSAVALADQSSHTYNRATALALVERITQRYAALFERLAIQMESLRDA